MNTQEMCTGPEDLIPGELRGFRMWNYDPLSYDLTAIVVMHGSWASGNLVAECKVRARYEYLLDQVLDHDRLCDCPQCFRARNWTGVTGIHSAPSLDCQCGIYGWYRPDSTRLTQGRVFGVFAASGRVLLGEHGFRAEKGRILAVIDPLHNIVPRENSTDPYWIALSGREFRERWEREGVTVFATLEELVEAHPADDVTRLLGRTVPEAPEDRHPNRDWMATSRARRQARERLQQYAAWDVRARRLGRVDNA